MDNQLELSTTSILSLFETTKEQRQSFIAGVVESIESGSADPLKVHLQVKCMEKIIEGLTSTDEKKNKDGYMIAKRYRTAIVGAAEKYGTKEFDFMNAKVKVGETGTQIDYSKCGDPIILDLLEQEKVLSAAIKERKTFLNSITKPTGVLVGDIDNGEMVTIYPPAKTSTTNVIITLK